MTQNSSGAIFDVLRFACAAEPMIRKPERREQLRSTVSSQAAASLAKLAGHRRDVILDVVATSAKELLRSSDLWQSLSGVIERIGEITGVDRVSIFEVDPAAPPGRGLVARRRVWSAPGVSTPPDFTEVTMDMSAVGLASWPPRLARGETVIGRVREFANPVREFLESNGVKTILAAPVFVDDRWWGLISCDDCRVEREWSSPETDTIRTLAEFVGAAIARGRRLQALADSNRIIENCPTLLYRLDARPPHRLTYVSHNIRRYGYAADELLASPSHWLQIIGSEAHPMIAADIKNLLSGAVESTWTELRLIKPDGSSAWFEGRGYPLRDEHNRPIAVEGILTDITERRAASEKIAVLARTDFLTGLPNRAAFIDRLNLAFARARRSAEPFAIHYLDLDRFKDVNDTLGHPVGDALLQAVAERLRNCVREVDLVARFGGDEFAVLQDETAGIGGAEALAIKIGAALAAPFSIAGNRIRTSASIGVVPYSADVAGPEAMMTRADLALYRAKDEGRDQFRFHVAELDRQVQERMAIGNDLHRALERDEFEIFYQPQVELASGRIAGLEALIRWNHPTRGLLLPSDFIPIAETTGSILAIEQWLIRQACSQMRCWRDQRIAPPLVAVNISVAQFKLASDLGGVVSAALARFDVAPGALELDLTESVLMETVQKHRDAFERLQRIGVGIAIDDFGAGFSSLGYLRSFRVSRIKIDRRFIENVATGSLDATIVRATIGLARALGVKVVAEGVETAEQRAFLVSAGCEMAQGYHLGGPSPAVRITELLRQAQ